MLRGSVLQVGSLDLHWCIRFRGIHAKSVGDGKFAVRCAEADRMRLSDASINRGLSESIADCRHYPLTCLPQWETLAAMRVIAKSSLKKFWERPGCADARGPLHSWYEEALKAKWRRPQDVKNQYASSSICGNNRVVFNVGGNKYRLVVEVQYQAGIVWVEFIGTHAQYDRIEVESVNDY
jgi:mRNA interferase HigB